MERLQSYAVGDGTIIADLGKLFRGFSKASEYIHIFLNRQKRNISWRLEP